MAAIVGEHTVLGGRENLQTGVTVAVDWWKAEVVPEASISSFLDYISPIWWFGERYGDRLKDYAAHLGSHGRGILAVGESTGTIDRRYVQSLLLSPPFVLDDLILGTPGAVECLSGVILSPDDLDRTTAAGQRFVDVLKNKGVLPGVQVSITHGSQDLGNRCMRYFQDGARFVKCCAVLKIDRREPSQPAINTNADKLARCALICQQNGLVPIVEPEILADGDHDIYRCAEVTERVLAACYKALIDNRVLLEGTVLKLNMVTPGSLTRRPVSLNDLATLREDVAKHTLRALQRTVPAAVPTVLLYSGQSEAEAPHYLNAMFRRREEKKPWSLSFSFGRRVSTSTLTRWGGREMDTAGVRAAFLARCTANSQATQGTYREPPSPLAQLAQLRIR